MEYIPSKRLREYWNDFWLSKQHVYLPGSSLIGGKESTAMFTIAGMQQLIPYLSGKKHPLGKRLFNIQKCVRTVDIDEVGDTGHLTFFEMMGNRSLGDYFKKEAVQWSREFLVDVLHFDPKKIAVTVFEGNDDTPRDEEIAGYRKQVGIPKDKIAYMPADNNRWSPGPVGPCGPDTEIFYRIGDTEYPPTSSNPKTDEDHWLEIRNNVFMQFYRDETGFLTPLKNKNVDTGMGFERMAMVLQGKQTVFETDIFINLIALIENTLGITYTGNERRCRIVVDHVRTAFFLIAHDIVPSNEGRGYVLRRLIRRMYYNFMLLRPNAESVFESFITQIVTFVDSLMETYANTTYVTTVLIKEAFQFQKTITYGQKLLDELLQSTHNVISGKDIFKLYDTFGFPLELTKEIAAEKGLQLDIVGFEKEMEKQQARSRAGSKDMFKQGIDWATYLQGIAPTIFVGYETLDTTKTTLLKDFEVQGQRVLIFDRTSFYAESGGQVGDTGQIVLDSGEIVTVTSVQKYNGIFLHFVH